MKKATLKNAASVLRYMLLSPFSRVRDVVAIAFDDLPDEHHGVILMHDVVTVERITSDKVAEAEERLGLHVVFEPDDVFAPVEDQSARRRRSAVDREKLKLLEVDVRRMLPAARAVRYHPMFDRILRDARSYLLALRIHRAAVDGPIPVRAVEIERARNAR